MSEEVVEDNRVLWLNPTMAVFILFHYDVFHYREDCPLILLTDKEKQNVQKRLCTSLQGTPWSPYQKNQMILGYLRDDLEYMCEDLKDGEAAEFRVGSSCFAIRKKRRVIFTAPLVNTASSSSSKCLTCQ